MLDARVLLRLSALTVLIAPGCSNGDEQDGSSFIKDTGQRDATLVQDSGFRDAMPIEDAAIDAGFVDSGHPDATTDAGMDAGIDAGTDAGQIDSAIDAGAPDATEEDTGVTDSGTTPDAGTVDSGPTITTTIRVHYDTGIGNRIAIRGDSAGLSWTSNVDATWTAGNVWEYTSNAWSTEVRFKPVFVFPDDSIDWANGTNYLVQAGDTLDIYPFFFNSSGSVVSTVVTSTIYAGPRTVEVYLPPSYNEPGASSKVYPVLFMQDGQNLFGGSGPFGGWQVDGSLDQLMASGWIGSTEVGSIREFIVVAPHHGTERVYEYTPTNADHGTCNASTDICGGGADDYLDFLLQEVKPIIDAQYRTGPLRPGIAGSSLGGLVSMHACWSRPAQFSHCGVFSPSLWWDNRWMIDQVDNYSGTKKDLIIYLDAGDTSDGSSRVITLSGILQNKPSGQQYTIGTDLLCLIGQGHEHNELAWRARTPWAMHFLYADPDRSQTGVPFPAMLSPCP